MQSATIHIRAMRTGEHVVCERILRALPDWFGIEESLVQYVADTQRFPTILALAGDVPAGFLTLHQHFPGSAEIHCMAVRKEFHRQGVGRMMVQHVERDLRAAGVHYLQVKTQGPSRPCEAYAKTRKFYEAIGFVPLEEIHGLWPGNPCLMLVKSI